MMMVFCESSIKTTTSRSAAARLKLPRTEFLIFSRLARTPNRIVTADDLWGSVWGGNKPLNTESLHVYIYRLRAKLATFGLQIETMVNVGYRLITSKS